MKQEAIYFKKVPSCKILQLLSFYFTYSVKAFLTLIFSQRMFYRKFIDVQPKKKRSFVFKKMRIFQRQVVVMVAQQCKCT